MSYDVDASGMRTGITESDTQGTVRTVLYDYDATKRLVEETIDHRDDANDRVSHWTYDRVGNRESQTTTVGNGLPDSVLYVYDDNDRLQTETVNGAVTSYTYDDNGNTKTKSGNGVSVAYSYDDANRLIDASDADGSTRYVYDADGLRVRGTHTPTGGTATTTWYVQDKAYAYAQAIEEYTQEGSGLKRLAVTTTFADDLVSQTRYDDVGTPTTRYVQADGFGSTRRLTDENGNVTDTIGYDAFGNVIARAGTTEIEHLYRGEALDPNTGFYYLRARHYDPGSGRFLTQDTWMGRRKHPPSLNKYVYGESDPITFSDPSGRFVAAGGLGPAPSVAAIQLTSAVVAQTTLRTIATRLLLVLGTAAITTTIGTMETQTQRSRPTTWCKKRSSCPPVS